METDFTLTVFRGDPFGFQLEQRRLGASPIVVAKCSSRQVRMLALFLPSGIGPLASSMTLDFQTGARLVLILKSLGRNPSQSNASTVASRVRALTDAEVRYWYPKLIMHPWKGRKELNQMLSWGWQFRKDKYPCLEG